MCLRTKFLVPLWCCTCLRTMKPWSKMTIKDRSPTMRHVSRIQSFSWTAAWQKPTHTKHQIADILAKGHFTRDEWNNLLCLINISHWTSLPSQEFQLGQLHRKDGEEGAGTKRRKQDCGEIQANGDEPDQFCCYKFFICEQSDCVEKPGDTQKLQVDRLDYQGGLMQAQIKFPSPTQRRVLKDGKEMLNCSSAQGNLRQWTRIRSLWIDGKNLLSAQCNLWQLNTKDVEEISKFLKHQKIQNPKVEFGHIISVCHQTRKSSRRKPTDNLKCLDVNIAVWGIFVSVTLQAAVHLGRDYSVNLRSVKNQSSKSVDQLFRTTEKLIQEQTESTGLSTINWDQPMWKGSSLLCDRAVRILKPKPTSSLHPRYVWETSVQNLFKPGKTKLNGICKHAISKNWIEMTVNRWNSSGKISPGFTTLWILTEIQKMMAELKCEPEQLQGRIIIISMYNDIIWATPGNEENCLANSVKVATYAKRFPFGCWSYLGPGCEKKWYETHVNKPNGEWNRVAEIMMINFAESGHPIFHATSTWERRGLKSKEGGKKTIHHNGSEKNRWIDSSQSSFCQSAQYLRRSRRSVQRIRFKLHQKCDLRIFGDTDWKRSSTSSAQRNLLQDYFEKFAELPEDQKLSKLCKYAGFSKKIEERQFFIAIGEGSDVGKTACREHTQPRNLTASRPRRWIRSNTKLGPVWDV